MRSQIAALVLVAFSEVALAEDDWIDALHDHLAVSGFQGGVRAQLSGLFDFESYYTELPAGGLLFTNRRLLLNPRLSLFLDAQLGSQFYLFAQARLDRGFDPTHDDAEMRLDEYALRFTPWADGRIALQVGKFATVVGTWVQRHYSWDNPFITAPLPYENLTAVWDSSAPGSARTLRSWAHILPEQSDQSPGDVYSDKYLRNPIIWGPSYGSGIAVTGRLGKFEYAAEIKNTSLSARPESWDITETSFENPTLSTRLGFRPNPTWNLGLSASAGSYFLPEAAGSLPPGKEIGDYRELVLGQDISFAWHHLQIWAEFYEARFEVPVVGNADTFAYYIEAKYKLTSQLFGALRWNQQLFATIRNDTAGRVPWGDDRWRIDAALGYRFTAHTQLKAQYSLEHHDSAIREFGHVLAGQFTLKF